MMRSRRVRTEQALEQELRELPPPTPPAGLESRLLARLPAEGQMRAEPGYRVQRWLAWPVAAVLALAVLTPLALRWPEQNGGAVAPGQPAPGRGSDGVPQGGASETRSCDILPPLPSWS